VAPKFAIDIHADADDLIRAVINFSGSGANAIVVGVPGQIIKLYKIFFTVAAASLITFQDGAANLSGALSFTANGSMTLFFDTKPWFVTSVGNSLNLNSTNAVQVSGTVHYQQG
jgi:hypothetical protein